MAVAEVVQIVVAVALLWVVDPHIHAVMVEVAAAGCTHTVVVPAAGAVDLNTIDLVAAWA